MYIKFTEQLNTEEEITTKYEAGNVTLYDGRFQIEWACKGAIETFSIGQPVYDKDGNIMGWLGLTLLGNLNYHTETGIRVPVENWEICLPTEYCMPGKKVFTYWQNKARKENK